MNNLGKNGPKARQVEGCLYFGRMFCKEEKMDVKSLKHATW